MKVEEYKRADISFTSDEVVAINTTKKIIYDLASIADTFGLIELEGNEFDRSNFEEAFGLLDCLFYELYNNNSKVSIENEENYWQIRNNMI